MTSSADNITPLRKTLPCPQCGKPSTRKEYPFCTQRCRNLDLGAWLDGKYAIAVEEPDKSEQ